MKKKIVTICLALSAICLCLFGFASCKGNDSSNKAEQSHTSRHTDFTFSGNVITGLTAHGKTLEKICIPSEIGGAPVTSIGRGAFIGCSNLRSVTIEDGVTSIGVGAFVGCSNLTSVTIPSSVISIGSGVFGACDSLQYNEYDNAYYLGNANNPYVCLVEAKSKNITSCKINDNCKVVCSGAFQGCDCLTAINVDSANNTYKSIDGDLYTKDEKTLVQYAIGKAATLFVVPNGVNTIGEGAFCGCDSLTRITVLSGVTLIGVYAFGVCGSLTEINVDSANAAYKSIDGNLYTKNGKTLVQYAIGKTATSFVVPSNVTSIGDDAFVSCSSLISIIIPDGVVSIGDYAFYDCSRLTSITIPNSVTSIGGSAFMSCSSLTSIAIPDGVTSIGDLMFCGCGSLVSITIPNSVTSIGDGAFVICSSLISIIIPDSVVSIGDDAFYGCESLQYNEYDNAYYLGNANNLYMVLIKAKSTEITGCNINASCKIIFGSAFRGCRNLKSVTVGRGVTLIGDYAFGGCGSLTEINVDSANAAYKSIDGNLYTKNGKTLVQYAIGKTATSFVVPSGVAVIGNSAFHSCDNLTDITIGSGVTSVEEGVFAWCSGLVNVTISDSVTLIGYNAFFRCSSLKNVYYKGTADDWEKISINTYNTYLTSATRYYYSETNPFEEENAVTSGNYWHYDTDGKTPIVWKKKIK